MKRSIWAMVSVATAAIVAAGPAGASCGLRGRDACPAVPKTVNLSAVPGISQQIVNQEPTGAKAVTQTLEAPPITTYTGPMVGVDKMVHAPTVGYYWSLEPDSSGH